MNELFAWLVTEPTYTLVVCFLVSLLVGSFLNVVIYRVPAMMEREWQASIHEGENSDTQIPQDRFNLAVPASTCPHCGHRIRWYENIPVVSYLFLKGQCSQCHAPISLRYPLIELLTAILSTLVIYQLGFNYAGFAAVVFTWALISLTFIDVDHQLLPDRITLPLLWLGLLVNSQNLFTSLHSAVFGAVAGYLVLWSVYWLFKLVTGKEGMGYGDFKLLAALGAWCGISQIPLLILLSSVAGVLLAMLLMLFKRHEASNPLPFGPYLAIAGWIALLWGHDITSAYLQLY
ncbi:prepilin peptidase [Neptunomonas concharum]|uniref:Prepilin leader peptidase/N-methyltransferase n=1 Tax=Neptunomonas concharum TaxID=1031538 RepID=A0A5P1R8S5_9GAMM|nr:A24 family peptidase [Neptunomonas concharum]QEQ96039.1 prepilin peptidase [Neptunomonas concharum]